MKNERALKNKKTDWKKWGFYFSIMTLPIINFIGFTCGGLLNTVGLGFFGYDVKTDTTYWNSFANFIDVFRALTEGGIARTFLVSLIYYAIGLINMAMGYIMAFYIYKKLPWGEFFRILLFMPSIITGMVWVSLFKYLVREPAFAQLFGLEYGLLSMPNTAFYTLMFYTLWMGMCGGVFSSVGFMGGVSPELVDSCYIDGCNRYGEFIHVIIPALWPFLSVNLITGVVGLFMSGPPLFAFFDTSADRSLWSFDYYLFSMVMKDPSNKPNQMYSAAASLLVTAVVAPITFGVKWLCNKYGPNED